jgi:ferric-dicitrate binding protein FerR (iron transport regulator)
MTHEQHDRDDRMAQLEDQWRRWAARPATTRPEAAARAFLELLPARRRRGGYWPVAAGLAAAALALALAIWPERAGQEATQAPPTAASRATALLDETVALIWLDPETPLYLTLGQPSRRQSEGDS